MKAMKKFELITPLYLHGVIFRYVTFHLTELLIWLINRAFIVNTDLNNYASTTTATISH